MQNYLSCKLPKMDKDEMVKFNPIAWWKDNQHSYPLLSEADTMTTFIWVLPGMILDM